MENKMKTARYSNCTVKSQDLRNQKWTKQPKNCIDSVKADIANAEYIFK